MSFNGGVMFTNRGRALQAKAQAGASLVFTRIGVGDGQLGSQAIEDLTDLINPIKSLDLNKFKTLPGGKAVVGAKLSNQDITTGFYWRELGLFATDPDLGEILYCYGNAGALAEYIPSPGGAEILEKQVDIVSIIGNAANVSATLDSSLVYVTQEDFDALAAVVATKETPAGAQAKVDALAGEGNTKTVKELDDAFTAHLEEKATLEDLGHVKVDGETIQIDENGIISGSITQNKNLLHNWDFRNPVNQRGLSSYTGAGYTIDRWRLPTSGHTIELVPEGIKITSGGNSANINHCFGQRIENYKDYEGKTVTLSVHVVENTLTKGIGLRWNTTAVGPNITGTGYYSATFTLPSSLVELEASLQFVDRNTDSGKYVVIDKMKLEIGSTSTLANDPPADYGEQLALCQRYYIRFGDGNLHIASGNASETTAINFILNLPVSMRIYPTISYGNINNIKCRNGITDLVVSSFVPYLSKMPNGLYFGVATSGAIVGDMYQLRIINNDYIELSADL